MTKRILMMVVGIFLLLLFSFSPVSAQEERHEHAVGECSCDDIPEHLRLTGEQRELIKQIRKKYAIRHAALESELRDINHAIYAELAKDEPREGKLDNLRRQRVVLFSKIQKLVDRMYEEIKQVLTEDQRAYYPLGNFDFQSLPSFFGFYTCPYTEY